MKSQSHDNLSDTYRQRALLCEMRKRESYSPAIQQEWGEMAIGWHLLAGVTAKRTTDLAIVS